MDNKILRRNWLWAGFILLSALPGRAAVADFTGTWKLDAGRSQFGRIPPPPAILDRVSQSPTEITVHRDRGGESVVIHIPLDSSSRENAIRGMSMKTHGRLTPETLVVDYDGKRAGGAVHSEERWSVSPDGKTLTVKRHLVSPQGETDQTLVFAKQ